MTRLASEGIGLTHGEDALIADQPIDFARSIVDAYQDRDLWRGLSVAGRRQIRAQFSAEVARAALTTLCDELGVETGQASR
jgi:hypothetical protein